MSKTMLLVIGVGVVAAVLLLRKKGSATAAKGASSPTSVAQGGQQSYRQLLEQNAWGIAQTQLGNIFGGATTGASPSGSEIVSNDQLLRGELGSYFGG
jgi:hypothetical protein